MHCFNFFFTFLLVLIFGFFSAAISVPTDSLQVKIVNTDREIGTMRFIERDTSNIILRVIDAEGNAFKQLNPRQVQIFNGIENAKILKVTPLQATIETNLNVVLALDNSSSMQGSTKELLQSVELLLNTLRDKSRIAVVLFDESTALNRKYNCMIGDELINAKYFKFSSNIDSVMNFIRWNYTSNNLTSRTYLHDELLYGLQMAADLPKNLLRVMIVLSDGQDLGSKFGFSDVHQSATKLGIPIYCIDYSDSRDLNETLTKLSSSSGQGKVYRAEKATDLMPVFDALSKELITEFQVTYQFPIPPSGWIQFSGANLTITSRNLVDEFPMLNYVFFDSNSVEINPEYHQFSNSVENADFDETKIQKPLDKYYHVLNVIGSRARTDSTAKLTITGCNMNSGAEQGNLTLSRNRAETISRYLRDIWEIEQERIKIQARNLPLKNSSNRTLEGQAENRRVEITSDHAFITRPIRSEVNEYLYQPEIGRFTTNISATEGLKNWEFHAYQDDALLTKLIFTEPKSSITWNWINDAGDKISEISQLDYAIKITDSGGRGFESPRKSVPVFQTTESSIMAEANQDTLFEKFSLVLFDFNSSRLSESNQYLMQKVLARYTEHPDATMSVYGYSDSIGDEEYNQKLSAQRAKTAYDILVKMKIPREKLSYLGYGEINPIFSNATPEGRFLNRTVQIYIRYPKPVEE